MSRGDGMRKDKVKGNSILNADGRKEDRYVRASEIRQRREVMRRSWQEISEIGKRGLN